MTLYAVVARVFPAMRPEHIDAMPIRDFMATVREYDAGQLEEANARKADVAEAVRAAMGDQDPESFGRTILAWRGYPDGVVSDI